MKFPLLRLLMLFSAALFTGCGPARSLEATADNSAITAPVAQTTPAVVEVKPQLDVPYVPTHQMIVDEMLKMGEVKGGDVLYDLGSGDGRIPITAAQRFGTRGVGIDINPERIREANENAQKANMANRVRFTEADLFTSDFSEATVITLYLLPSVNLRLRPRLLELKPGTRIVSHNYDMGDWEPEKTKTITTPDDVEHFVYFWRVPEKSN